jgi:hypothetical protein
MNFPGKNLFFNQKVIALISLVLFSFLLVGALRMVGLYEGLEMENMKEGNKAAAQAKKVAEEQAKKVAEEQARAAVAKI